MPNPLYLAAVLAAQNLEAFQPVSPEREPAPAKPLAIEFADEGFDFETIFELEYAAQPAPRPNRDELVYLRVRADRKRDRYVRELWWLVGQDHLPMVTGLDGISSPSWSPDGGRLAFLAQSEGKPQIYVHWPEQGRTALLTRVPDGVKSFVWAPDGASLAFTSPLPAPNPSRVALPKPPQGGKWAAKAIVVDRAVYRRDGRGFVPKASLHIFVVDASGGAPVRLTRGFAQRKAELTWARGSVIFSANPHPDAELNPMAFDLFAVDVKDRSIRRLTSSGGPESKPIASADGRLLAFLGHEDEGKGWHPDRLFVLDLDSGEVESWLADRDISFQALRPDPKGWLLAWVEEGVGRVGLAEAPDRLRTLASNVEVGGGGRPYVGFGLSGAFGGTSKRLVVARRNASRPSEIFEVGRRDTRIVTLNPGLSELRLGPLQGGRTPSGVAYWRLLPPGLSTGEARRLPTLLEIHGGPYASYGAVFSAELQLYASAGYMVLYANPRGSTSYGSSWADAIEKNYPGPDVDDLMEVLDVEVAAGRADPDRLHVTGGSGGGVLTAWLVGTTDRFRSAVVAKPVINWTSFALTADQSPYFTRYWFRRPPWEDQATYWRRSPLSKVGAVKTPTMLLTGEADLRTPIAESEQFYQALRQRGVPSAMVRLPGASHGIARRPSHLISKVGHVLYWLKTHP
ncbi:MAG: S9 family peptidase [Myxococcota bacterium]